MADIFISYNQNDRDWARKLAHAFHQFGLTVFWDRKIPPGKTFAQFIEEQLDCTQCVVVLWSRNSIVSYWVGIEAEEGRSRGILVPAMIEVVKPPLAFRPIQAANLCDWQPGQPHDEFEALLTEIGYKLGRPLRHSAPEPEIEPEPQSPKPTPPTSRPVVVSKDFTDAICGIKFLYVPGGTFMMGTEDWEDSKPVHPVTLSPFWLAETTVTNAQYAKFLADNKQAKEPGYWQDSKFNNPQQPVVGIDWNEAVAFCQWLSAKTGKRVKLPSEAQWEFAARGPKNLKYPWGDQEPNDQLACFGLGSEGQPAPVGSYPQGKGPFGHLDLAGNVWEWCEDVWNENAYREPGRQKTDPVTTTGDQERRSLRGGSFWDVPVRLRSASRHRLRLGSRYRDLGLRLVVSAPST